MRIKKIAMFLLTVTLAGTAVMPANAAESANIEEMSAEQFLDAENVDNYATEDAADEERAPEIKQGHISGVSELRAA